MKIGLIGYGRMGKLIGELAPDWGHVLTAIIDHSSPQATAKAITASSIANTDVCIEFTSPSSVLKNCTALAAAKKNAVIGTTGWENELPQVRKIVEEAGIGVIYGANFSLGVHLFLRLVAEAAKLLDAFPEYDVGVIEQHHNKKADNPSGTAKAIAARLLEGLSRKRIAVFDRLDHHPHPEELHVTSLRCGHIPGTHEVIFDSSCDTISLSHTARGRTGFAEGALRAAEWIRGKKGLYTIEDMLA